MKRAPIPERGLSLVELLLITAIISILGGVATVGITGVRERAKQARLLNDVAVLNTGIDAYLAAGGTIPAGASAEQVVAKLKTVADPATSTYLGASGPFIDPRIQLVRQSAAQGAQSEPRADYPNSSGYFYVRQGGAPGISEIIRGEATPTVTETRTGPLPYVGGGGWPTDFEERPAATPTSAVAPDSVEGADDEVRDDRDLAKLPRPVLTVRYSFATNFVAYNGETLNLSNYPMDVRVVSPLVSTSSQLQIAWDTAATNVVGSPYVRSNLDIRLYTNTNPVLKARVMSTDTGIFTNSDPLEVTFRYIQPNLSPVFPAATNVPTTLTYQQAGGPMLISGVYTSNARPPITISLSNIEKVPSEYFDLLDGSLTTTFTRRYDGVVTVATNSSFSRAGGFQTATVPIDVAGFGSSVSMRIVASIQSRNTFLLPTGADLDRTISLVPTPLSVDIFPLKPIGLPPSVTITDSGNVPVGMRKFYTLTAGGTSAAPLNPVSGGVPTAAAQSYSVPITTYPIATYTVAAQATGPAGTEHWFTCSPVNRTYIAITTVPLKYIGLNMFEANINGYVKGSIYMQAGAFAVLNAGATIEGNVYVPGTPAVVLPSGTDQGRKVVNRGQAYNQAEDAGIETNRITGREYTTEGVLADPQTDLRKIVDLYGSDKPQNYDMKVNNTARIDGKLYRRADPPPVSSTKPGLPAGVVLSNTAVTVAGTNTLAGGSYALTLNNTNSVLRLGVPGTITSYVFGTGSTWTGGRVEILGPVQIYFNYGPVNISGVTFGSSNSVSQTGFVVMSNYTVTINNGASVYGQFEARDSEIQVGSGGGSTIRGSFYGSAFARKVSVDGSGYVDVSGGSDTNATPNPTPTPTPTPRPTATP